MAKVLNEQNIYLSRHQSYLHDLLTNEYLALFEKNSKEWFCLEFAWIFSKTLLPRTFLILMSCSLLYLSVIALNLRTSGEEFMMFGFFRQKLPRIYDSVFNSFLGYCTFEQIAVGFSVAKGLPVRNLQETTTITARKSLWFPQQCEMCKL